MSLTFPRSESPVDELDRRIIAALQVNGRAGWRQIASVIGAPERTVAAHGAELIRSGRVGIHGFTLLPTGGRLEQMIVKLRCQPGMNRVMAAAAADRPGTVFTFLTTGEIDCICEIVNDQDRNYSILLDELPGLPGVTSIDTSTVIKLYKATHQWLPTILDDDQVAALRDASQPEELTGAIELPPLSREEQEMARVLAEDGRATIEELARATALSPASARRRLAHMQAGGRLYTRTTGGIDRVARILADVPEIRYLAFTTGRHQLLAEIACSSQEALAAFLFRDDWTAYSLEVDTSLVIHALKRSGRRRP